MASARIDIHVVVPLVAFRERVVDAIKVESRSPAITFDFPLTAYFLCML